MFRELLTDKSKRCDIMVKLTLIQGDCLKVLPKIPSESIDLVVTSPPYNINIDYGVYKDNIDWDSYYNWCRKWLKELYRVLKKDGRLCLNHYLSMGQSGNRHAALMDLNWIATREIGFKHHSVAIWTDNSLSSLTSWGSWLSAKAPYIKCPFEGILILYKQTWKKLKDGKSTIKPEEFIKACSGIWNIKPCYKRLTPASFPIELPSLCIKLLTYEGDTVLDPFLGSGTTMLAALQLNRNCIGIEINPEFVEIARNRILLQCVVKDAILNCIRENDKIEIL